METGCHVNELIVSPLSPHQSGQVRLRFPVRKGVFLSPETVLHCVSGWHPTSQGAARSLLVAALWGRCPVTVTCARRARGRRAQSGPNSLQPYALRPTRLLCPQWQEYWRGLPLDPPNPGVKPTSAVAGGLSLSQQGSPPHCTVVY